MRWINGWRQRRRRIWIGHRVPHTARTVQRHHVPRRERNGASLALDHADGKALSLEPRLNTLRNSSRKPSGVEFYGDRPRKVGAQRHEHASCLLANSYANNLGKGRLHHAGTSAQRRDSSTIVVLHEACSSRVRPSHQWTAQVAEPVGYIDPLFAAPLTLPTGDPRCIGDDHCRGAESPSADVPGLHCVLLPRSSLVPTACGGCMEPPQTDTGRSRRAKARFGGAN